MSEPAAASPGASATLVSVGIPVYNGEKHLRQALDSVLRQDHPNLEVVISDNASTDGTRAICKEYARRDPRVRYLRNKENLGASANFKKVMRRAQGEYFTWLACDDFLSQTDYLSTLAAYLDAHPDVVLCGSSIDAFADEDPVQTEHYVLAALAPERPWRDARKEFFRFPQSFSHFAIYGMSRREALKRVPLDGRTLRGRPIVLDIEFPILSAMSNLGRIVALPGVKRAYRSHAASSAGADIELPARTHAWLALGTKAELLVRAARMNLPAGEKWELIWLTLFNFVHHHKGRHPEFRAYLESLRKELAKTRTEYEKRLADIDHQRKGMQYLKDRVAALESQLAHANAAREAAEEAARSSVRAASQPVA